MQVIPIFKSHFSIGRSILTLAKKGSSTPTGPDSIVDIASENNLKQVVLIDESFAGFLEAYKNLSACNIQLIFGVQMVCCQDLTVKDEASLQTEHKIIVVAKNEAGYKKLIKIYSKAATDGFYYAPRIDLEYLSESWSDEDLELWIPFYDSYLHKNMLASGHCFPKFRCSPKYLYQDNSLPFDGLIQNRLKSLNVPLIPSKSIFYKNKSDFKHYLTFRCINNRTNLDKPEFENMSSDEFSFESWLEQNKKGLDV